MLFTEKSFLFQCYEGTKIYLNVLSHTDLIKLFDKKKNYIFKFNRS